MTDLLKIAENLAAAGLDHPAVDDAVIKLTNLAAHPSRGVVDEIIAALDQISGLTRALRNGGPAPEDLQGLSDALTEATNVAWCASRALQAAALPAVPEDWREDVSLAAQMLTWGRDEGLDEKQIKEIDAHAERLFAMLAATEAATPAHDQPEGSDNG